MTTAQIEQSEVRDAAEAMLAALKEATEAMVASQKNFRALREIQMVKSLDRPIRENRAAIAQAEAVGIRVKD